MISEPKFPPSGASSVNLRMCHLTTCIDVYRRRSRDIALQGGSDFFAWIENAREAVIAKGQGFEPECCMDVRAIILFPDNGALLWR